MPQVGLFVCLFGFNGSFLTTRFNSAAHILSKLQELLSFAWENRSLRPDEKPTLLDLTRI